MTEQIAMIRNVWDPEHKEFHVKHWLTYGVTVLICQRKTMDLIMLCLESLLRFYPDIPILVVDGDSQDDSIVYLRWMAVKYPNIRIWEKKDGYHSHGVTMDTAIRHHIDTPYVLLMDSDTIVERGYGLIERMRNIMEPYPVTEEEFDKYAEDFPFAVGSLMLVSRKNQGCGPPENDNDVLRYAHPSFSMIRRSWYMELEPFTDHGAPCWATMANAAQKKWAVEYFPVDKYVSHLSGASWCVPRTIWPDDHSVLTRPFVTFIIKSRSTIPIPINSWGYEMLFDSTMNEIAEVVIHGDAPMKVKNTLYPIRFSVRGDYVCAGTRPSEEDLCTMKVADVIKKATELNGPDSFEWGGWIFLRRDIWQRNCFL